MEKLLMPSALLLGLWMCSCARAEAVYPVSGVSSAVFTAAPVPAGWTLKSGGSIDSLAGSITTSNGLKIEVDIGPMASSFREPRLDRCRWRMEGQNPDFYAWTPKTSPRELQMIIRNLNPEGGAFWFQVESCPPEAMLALIEQTLASHESIRSALMELR